MNNKCNVCGYAFIDDHEEICPECLAPRENTISCNELHDDHESVNNINTQNFNGNNSEVNFASTDSLNNEYHQNNSANYAQNINGYVPNYNNSQKPTAKTSPKMSNTIIIVIISVILLIGLLIFIVVSLIKPALANLTTSHPQTFTTKPENTDISINTDQKETQDNIFSPDAPDNGFSSNNGSTVNASYGDVLDFKKFNIKFGELQKHTNKIDGYTAVEGYIIYSADFEINAADFNMIYDDYIVELEKASIYFDVALNTPEYKVYMTDYTDMLKNQIPGNILLSKNQKITGTAYFETYDHDLKDLSINISSYSNDKLLEYNVK